MRKSTLCSLIFYAIIIAAITTNPVRLFAATGEGTWLPSVAEMRSSLNLEDVYVVDVYKTDGRNRQNNREADDNALVVRLNEMVGAAEKDQRAREEGGAVFGIIVILGLVAVFSLYQAGRD